MNRRLRRFFQSGFSLLEVLVTMVIIAVGLMGFAAMMTHSMKNNRVAMQRSITTLYAYDIIDCMRANRTAVPGGYTIAFGGTPSGSTVATGDLTLWKNALASLLPSGDGQITILGNTVTVQISWTERLNASDNTDCPPGSSIPPCHTWKTVSTL
jgi:type IV pilus assembly protein PilV